MKKPDPFVSCIMPTYNRRKFVPNAIRYFLRQDYQSKELIIVDDGTDCIEDLVPDEPNIRYYRLADKITLGAKLNLGCELAGGELLANWDDDDWYAARRLSYQVSELYNAEGDVCGLNQLWYYDAEKQCGYFYSYPAEEKMWLLGSSLCYKRSFWKQHKFAEINVGTDALFVWSAPPGQVCALADYNIAVHTIHSQNVSKKNTDNAWWKSCSVNTLKEIIKADWAGFAQHSVNTISLKNRESLQINGKAKRAYTSLKNLYICMVHEREDCIVDLIRNLHFHDPDSAIILYNGSGDTHLLSADFPFEKFGAVIHPSPAKATHGYLFEHALNCMEFARRNFSFDILTIVDSDQVALRPGYSDFMSRFFADKPNAGLLSSYPGRIDQNNQQVWTARQAFKEFDLWKPFLTKFNGGENQFVHWSFWPSTVFKSDAVSEILKVWKRDKKLREIMTRTKIWATEEIVFPTLVKLLGFNIEKNPCSDEYIKYKQTFQMDNLQQACATESAFWMHPVARNYNDPLRQYAREAANHYCPVYKPGRVGTEKPSVILTTRLFDEMRKIDGWLTDKEAELLLSVGMKSCIDLPGPHHIVEVGSYKGKSTLVLAGVAKWFFSDARVFAIDPHQGTVGAADQGLKSVEPSLAAFEKNLVAAGVRDQVELIADVSYQVKWSSPICFLFIDALHDYFNVARDFWHFASWLNTNSYVAFHDYAAYYPGVVSFVDELIDSGEYRYVQLEESLMVLQKT